MRLNRQVRHMIVLTAIVCLIAAFAGWRGRARSSACTVALVPTRGMTILSDNPVRVKRGESAAFQVRFDEGCYPDEVPGVRFADGVLYVDDVRDSRSVRYSPRRVCALSVREEDANCVEFLSGDTAMTGDSAQIRVTAPEHYRVERVRVNEDAYSVPPAGTLSFPVYGDSRIALELAGEPLELSVTSGAAGAVRILPEREEYRYGDEITLKTEYDAAFVRFDGWSADAALGDGGAPLSAQPEVRFTLTRDMNLFANFTDLHTYTVAIDPNGGVADTALSRSDCGAGKSVYLPADTGALHRAGFALIGYNTRADGGGRHYATGSPILVGHEDVTVYAEWLPETAGDGLVYEALNGYAVVKGASRQIGDTLVIPATLGGLAVRGIDVNAFAGDAALRTVVVPVGVTHIGDGAFSGCPNLSMVYLPDTLKVMSDSAFSVCPSFQRLRVLASLNARVYELTMESTLADRYARLLNTDGRRIILVAGSSGSFGLNSPRLARRFPGYEVINFSGSYLFGMVPTLYYVSNNIHPGDVVIFAPEYYRGMYANRLTTELSNWMYLESDYNMLDELNQQVVGGSILRAFTAYLDDRRGIYPDKRPPDGKAYARSAYNEYGDVVIPRAHRKEVEPYSPDPELINSACVSAYTAAFEAIVEKGGVCLFSFPPISDGGASLDSQRAPYDAFTERLKEAFAGAPVDVISSAADYVFPADVFYDNRYHMTLEGAELRTDQLIADLEAWGLDRQGGGL